MIASTFAADLRGRTLSGHFWQKSRAKRAIPPIKPVFGWLHSFFHRCFSAEWAAVAGLSEFHKMDRETKAACLSLITYKARYGGVAMSHPTLRLFDGMDDTSPELQDDVRELQTDLNRFGLNLPVDGIFGSETEGSVRQFQLDHDLVSDGIVGPQTWAALKEGTPPDPATVFFTTISNNNTGMRAQFAAAQKFKPFIDEGAQQIGVPSIVIAGIGSRESGWGLNLRPPDPSGTGDFGKRKFPTAFRAGALPPDGGYGRGLMQIDFDAFPFARTGNWKDPQANISFGCKVLKSDLDLLGRKSSLIGRNLLQAAVAAYNCGAGNVLTAINNGHDLDFFTTGRNYSADVLNRAGFFQNMGWETQVQGAGAAGG